MAYRKGINEFGFKDFSTWLSDNSVPKGCVKANVRFLRELQDVIEMVKVNNSVMFFLVAELGIYDCRKMLLSGRKVRNLLSVVAKNLKEKQVTKEYIPVFEAQIKRLTDRQVFVLKIAEENIRLSKYYPFFMEHGFDSLLDFDSEFGDTDLLYMKDVFADWEKNNADKISQHMANIKPELDRINSLREQRAADRKLSKQLQKNALEAEKKFDKETERILAEQRKNNKLANMIYESYCD